MPFTFAHPAVVLPLNRLFRFRLSLSALIIGSMIPDFEGFLLVTDVKTYSHTWHGMFWLDIPLGVAIAFLFHGLIRDSLIDNLPLFFRRRFIAHKRLNWSYYFRTHAAIVVFSLFLGIFSHLVWDDFTHLNGFFVRHIPFLQQWFRIGGKLYPVWKILQFATSVIGLAVVLVGIALMPPQENTRKHNISIYWLIVFSIAGSVVAFRFLMGLEISDISLMFATAMSGGLLGITVASVLTAGIARSVSR